MSIIRDRMFARDVGDYGSPVSGLDSEAGPLSNEFEVIQDAPRFASWELTLLAGVGIVFISLVLGVTAISSGAAESSEACSAFFMISLVGFIGIVAGAAMKARHGSIVSDLESDYSYEDTYYEPEYEISYDELRSKRQMEEIVKMVKSTIKIRCRYCGTLNDESAVNCDACGAPL